MRRVRRDHSFSEGETVLFEAAIKAPASSSFCSSIIDISCRISRPGGAVQSNPCRTARRCSRCDSQNGVLVAGDRLATAGHPVASRDVVKVFETDPYSVMAISGAAGPCIEMARILSVELEHYEKIEGEAPRARGQGQQALADDPGESAGGDAGTRGRAALRRLRHSPQDAAGSGSSTSPAAATKRPNSTRPARGGLYARESLKHGWTRNLARDDAVKVAVAALRRPRTRIAQPAASTSSAGSIRSSRCAPRVVMPTPTEAEIAACYREILAARAAGGNR